jgi:hypothetical protein
MATWIKGILFIGLFAAAQAHARDFDSALKLHARSYAHDLLAAGIKAKPDQGVGFLFEHYLPASIDDRCGYAERAGLNEPGFERKKTLVESVVGQRLVEAYGRSISRRGARLDLAGVDVLKLDWGEHALVRLIITPAHKGDEILGLLYRYDTQGDLALCDVTIGATPQDGVLSALGRELSGR